jgi:hypothetical protein
MSRFFRSGIFLTVALLGTAIAPAAPIAATDVDGRAVRLNAPGAVTAVISSSPATQQQTRDSGKALDRFRGRADFRLVVVVDLHGSMAGIVSGYVRDRMRHDLDTEAERLKPAYQANGNSHPPRPDLEGVVDFDGQLVDALRWERDAGKLRVTVFAKDGREAARWADLKDYAELEKAVARALGAAGGGKP